MEKVTRVVQANQEQALVVAQKVAPLIIGKATVVALLNRAAAAGAGQKSRQEEKQEEVETNPKLLCIIAHHVGKYGQ